MKSYRENFRANATIDPSLLLEETGTGRIERGDGLRLVTESTDGKSYSNAQLYDYKRLKRRDYPNRPPLRMRVRAYASHNANDLLGTAGFGFWNQPFMPGDSTVRLPRALWFFFGSRPSNMALAKGVPGYGWKAATIDASRLPFLLLTPTTPLGILLMRIPALYRVLWPIGQRALGVAEKSLDLPLTEPHDYRLDWLPESVSFFVDDNLILQTPSAPRGPLGFVAWLDNQYAIVTPQGQLGFGIVPVPHRQWLQLDSLVIE